MKVFFNLTGRFGNLLGQYMYVRAYCERGGHTLCLPPWVGEKIFDMPLADRTPAGRCDEVLPEAMHQNQDSIIYTRKQAREWLRIRPEVLERLSPVGRDRRPVLLDVRQGSDYLGAGLVSLGQECYSDAAASYGYSPDDCEWELDTSPTRLGGFEGDVTASGLNTTWVSLPAFYRMVTAKVHFRANSTFSFWAATLGYAKVYAPVIRGMTGGQTNQYCENWVEGNWPVCADNVPNTDMRIPDE